MVFSILLVVLLSVNANGADQPSHIDTSLPATSISLVLKRLASQELGADQLHDILNWNTDFQRHHDQELEESFQILVERLDSRLKSVSSYLSKVSSELGASLNIETPERDQKLLPPCCSTHHYDGFNDHLGCSVIHLGYNGTRSARIAANVFNNMTMEMPPGIVRRFFMTTDRTTHLEFPAARACGHQAYTWHREMLVRTMVPQSKNVMVVLDRGVSLSSSQIDVGRAIAGFIIESLNLNDNISLLTIDSGLSVAKTSSCGSEWAKATDLTKKALNSHLNSINRLSHRVYDHVLALREAKKRMKSAGHLYFITTATSMSSPKAFAAECEELSRELGDVEIHIFLMDSNRTEDKMTTTTSADFLRAELSKSCKQGGYKIKLTILDSTLLLSYKIGSLFGDEQTQMQQWISAPWTNGPLSNEKSVMTMTNGVKGSIVGCDIDHMFLMQDFVLQPQSKDKYYFVILDKASQTVVHHPVFTGQDYIPQGLNLTAIEPKISTELTNRIFTVNHGSDSNDRQFIWRHVGDYLVVLLIKNQVVRTSNLFNAAAMRLAMPTPKLSQVTAVYHRLDLLSPQYQAKLCLHLHYPATLETGSVFLAPYAFEEAFQHLSTNMTDSEIMTYMRYLTSNATTNPGLKSDVRQDWLLLSQVLTTWKNLSFQSGMNNYIVRRFAASRNGVYFAFPGSPAPQGIDPARQDWYLTAQSFPGKVVLSRPRLDHGGAGYVLTVSKRVTSTDFVDDEREVVMGMDLTIGYINKMLFDFIPICKNLLNSGVRCFLFDHQGYMIIHPSLFSPGQMLDQNNHLAHLEPLATTLMLEDPSLVQRKRCRQFSDMTLQHLYEFNTSAGMQSLWTSSSEEGCLRYQVSLLPETNVFLGIVVTNANCSSQEATFCPCNVNGKRCILCEDDDDMTFSSCDCPCQCPLEQCGKAMKEPLCPRQAQVLPNRPFHLPEDLTLPPCFDTDCARHAHEDKCSGIIGCSWCKYSDVHLNLLDEPFCSDQDKCFGGVLGIPSPYDQLDRGSRPLEGDKYFFRPSTPSVAPIAGSILAAVLFLGFSAYCIRNVHKCSCVRGAATNGRRIQRCRSQTANFEEVILDDQDNGAGDELHELGGTHKNMLINESDVIISPYRVNTGYRRPPPGTDSDHGYSTMTPMGNDQDSEIVPYVESASARNRLKRLQQRCVPAQSVTSGVSSRTSSPIQKASDQFSSVSSTDDTSIVRGASAVNSNPLPLKPQPRLLSESSEELSPSSQQLLDPVTMLPRANKNQFIVSATVHMVDT